MWQDHKTDGRTAGATDGRKLLAECDRGVGLGGGADRQVQHFGESSAFHFPSTSPRHKTKNAWSATGRARLAYIFSHLQSYFKQMNTRTHTHAHVDTSDGTFVVRQTMFT